MPRRFFGDRMGPGAGVTQNKPKLLLFVVQNAPAACLDLTLAEKAVLQALVGHLNCRRNGSEVWPANATLAEITGAHVHTVARAKASLHDKGLIKIRRDNGKQDLCTIQEEVIRRLCDPVDNPAGSKRRPSTKSGGDPPLKAGGTLPLLVHRTSKEQQKNSIKKTISPVSCSSNLKGGRDADRQRQLALLGIVAETTERLRSSGGEQPAKNKKSEERVVPAAVPSVKERPG